MILLSSEANNRATQCVDRYINWRPTVLVAVVESIIEHRPHKQEIGPFCLLYINYTDHYIKWSICKCKGGVVKVWLRAEIREPYMKGGLFFRARVNG